MPIKLVSKISEIALQITVGVVKREVGYFFNYDDKFEEVKDYIEKLNEARERVQNKVNEAEMNAEEIEDDVKSWMKQVDEKIEIYESFIHDERQEKIGCSIGLFPNNLQLRYQLGREAAKILEEAKTEELHKKEFNEVSHRVRPSVDAALANFGYESFKSRTETVEKIMQALEDSTVNMLGVYGVGGVGKTTLVKEVAKKAQKKKLFNLVVMANITKNPNVKKIQGQIAEMLGMRLAEESEIVRADRIRKRFKKEKEKTLIILDDLWDGLDLNILGIPCGDDDGGSKQDVINESDFGYNKMEKEEFFDFSKMKKENLSVDHKGCKILLTSRSKEIICNQMDVEERSTFSVGVIDVKDSETLLKKVAGIHVTNSVFDGKATEIAQMCAGLPIALVSIGRALKNKSPVVWEDVCQQIKRQSFTEGLESIEFSVKLSYDHLKNELLKNIFLHCARMGNDALVMDLVKFCIGLGLLRGVQTVIEARNKVNVLIEELKESSLLAGSYSVDRFNMHDIVRDVALSISSKVKHVLFLKNGILDEWPHKDELERYTAISVHFSDIVDGLPESIYCPRLEVLHIECKDDSLKIPDDFFKDMIELRVLILTGVNLSCLPSSIRCLSKLRMLSLERCILGKNLSIIGELKKLRILTLSGSNIESLPLEFGQLDKLQLFDLSNCSKLRAIPSNIISRMKLLEEFYIRDSLIPWEAAENIPSEKASLSELRHLNQLRNLDIHIQSVVHFPQNLFFDELDGYKIFIGDLKMLPLGEFKIPDKHDNAKFLALNLDDGIDIHSERWIKMLFKGVEYLLLGELNDVRDVFYELNVEGFPNLKHFSIVNNFSIQYIIKSMELAFPKLESMVLHRVKNLEKICISQLAEPSFCNLKIIKIKACDQLEYLFPYAIVRLLTMLQTIEVCDCDSLKEIIFVESQTHIISDDKIVFPQLRLLTLQSLPAFTCSYSNDKIPSGAQSLEDHVPKQNMIASIISLFDGKVSVPKLERLELSSINIQKIWSDQSLPCFQNLLTLNVTDCGNLKYLLSFSMAASLVNLQSLSVNKCEMMENIFCPEDEEDVSENIDVFPKLKTMEIICLERLNTIWQPQISLHSFRILDSLIIEECHKLVTIFPSYTGLRFKSLQSLTITNCKLVKSIFDFGNIPQTCDRNETNLREITLQELPNLVHVWKDNTSEVLKCNYLQSICVDECSNLKYLFPISLANDLENLEIMDVRMCSGMEEIFAGDNDSNENVITFKFTHLNSVTFILLNELGSFYRGTHTLEWPSLRTLWVAYCSKLEGLTTEITNSQVNPIVSATEKVTYNLETIGVSLKEAGWLQKHIVSVHKMHKLESLTFFGLKNSEILLWFLHRLPNLKKLRLRMSHMKRIWAPGSLISHEKIGVVMQLKELELTRLFCLEDIGFEHDQLLQRVERLIVDECANMTNIASSTVSFSYLTVLEVTECRLMRNLMTCSTAKSLVQLTTMKVSSCPMIVEVVAENEEEKVKDIEFRQLKSLELISLQNLTSFCSSEKCDLKFPLLQNLVVSECPQMTKFSNTQSVPNLQKVHVVAGEKDKWYWEGDLNDTIQKHFANQVSWEYSEQMRLIDYPEMNGVRHGKPAFPDNYFGSLKKMEFDAECKREIVIPSNVVAYLKNLEELNVHDCHAAQLIFEVDDTDNKTKGFVFRLKILTLKSLPNLKCVWNKNPHGIVNFPNLKQVSVDNCECLVTLFPSSIARNLEKLKTLELRFCDHLVEIVGEEDELMEHGTTQILFQFPCLSKLVLYELPLLSGFYPGKHHLECPLLESLPVFSCPKLKVFTSEFPDTHKGTLIETPIRQLQQPLFSVEKVVPKLERLTMNEEIIMLLSDEHLPQHLLSKLYFLDLRLEDAHNNTLPFDFLRRVPNLEHLQVGICHGLKEIFPSEKLQIHEEILAGLKQLILYGLSKLDSIGLEYPWVKPYSENLERLALWGCYRLEKIVPCAVSFINLKQLEVRECGRMEYLFTFSTAKSLVQLESLEIKDCGSIKEIVKKEDEDDSHEIIFGRLITITLDSLPRLVRFYSGNATLEFSYLMVARVYKCPSMITFSERAIHTPILMEIETSMEDGNIYHDDINITIKSLFRQQIYLEYSKDIGPALHPKPAFDPHLFGTLNKLDIGGAFQRQIVIPSNVLPFLKCLEELNVNECYKAEVIFDIDDSETKTMQTVVSPLKILTLKWLSNLKCVWNKNPRVIVSFPNLEKVYVTRCGSLVTLFPSSIARNLEKLKTLYILGCDHLVEIVGKDDAMEDGTTEILFQFPRLSYLLLYKLPELSWFYPGKHHLECPLLEDLDVSYCPKLNLFTSEFHDSHKGVIEALFLVEKVVPKLRELTVNEESIVLLSDEHLPQHVLSKLNFLDLSLEDDYNNTLPFDFLRRVPNLEHLQVSLCPSLKEIFPSEKLQIHEEILSGLKQLTLQNLAELESIGLEYPWVSPYSENLESLTLWGCFGLEKIVPCAVSFVNLKQLEVTDCERMEYLFTFSTAKTLVQLESLEIQNCESIKEIVKKEDEDDSDGLIFEHLKILVLDSLPVLARFYSGNATLRFSCLRIATVAECPNMRTFSDGWIYALSFDGIKTTMEDSNDLTFHNDFNRTIQRLFHQNVERYACDIQHLKSGDHPYLGEIWLGVVPNPIRGNSFNNLKSLIMVECESLSRVIPFYLLRFLCNLKDIEVRNCQSVKAIFDVYHCNKLKVFTTWHRNGEVTDKGDQLGVSIDQQAVFSVEKVFPNLAQLSLRKEDAMAILRGQFQAGTLSQLDIPSLEHQEITKDDTMHGQGQFGVNAALFLQNSKVLKLMCYTEDDQSNIFAKNLLEEIPSVENLELICSSFKPHAQI